MAVGFALGYYLGAKAGRDRYVQLHRGVEQFRDWVLDPINRRPTGGAHPVGPAGRGSRHHNSQSSVELDDVPAELRSRVLAATAHAKYREIERRASGQDPEEFEVYAVAGDRVVHMTLALRPDGSVAEATETLLRHQIVEVRMGKERALLEAQDEMGVRHLSVPLAMAAAL